MDDIKTLYSKRNHESGVHKSRRTTIRSLKSKLLDSITLVDLLVSIEDKYCH